jgi:molybdopterin synthase sulfur carrier subunit
MATIKIPPVLRASVGGEKEVSASGENVGEVLRDLAANHPSTQSQLFSAEGELNRYVNVYLNDEDVRVLDGLDTAVGGGDTLVILPAMAGGRERVPRSRWRAGARAFREAAGDGGLALGRSAKPLAGWRKGVPIVFPPRLLLRSASKFSCKAQSSRLGERSFPCQ